MANISSNTPLPPWMDHQFAYLPFAVEAPSAGKNGAIVQGIRGGTFGFGVNVTCVEMSFAGGDDSVQFEVNEEGSSIQFSTSHRLQDRETINCVHLRSASHTANDTTNDNLGPFPVGLSALEVMEIMQPGVGENDEGYCASMIVAGWVRVGSSIVPNVASGSNVTLSPTRNVTSTFLSCTQSLLAAPFDIFVDSTGRIIESNQTGNFAADTESYFIGNANETALFQQSSALVAAFNTGDFQWHNDSVTSDWMNYLLGMIQQSSSLVDPSAPLPNATVIAPQVENLYQQLFAIMLGLNLHVFSEAPNNAVIPAQVIVVESRIFVSSIMFKLSTVILSLHLIVAILYYTKRPKRFLPRMPTTIASIIAYVSASRAVQDFQNKDGPPNDARYGYGQFIGTDGKSHIGIER